MSLRRFFNRAKWDRERREELESYVRMETDDNLARGMSASDARAAAQRKLGNGTRVREEIYRMNTIAWLDALRRDIRYSLRGLRRSPAFTAAALLTLAIGIGANTAVFSVINSVLLRPLNYPQPDQLVAVWHVAPGAPGLANVSGDLPMSPSMFFTYAESNRSFQAIGIWTSSLSTVTGLREPEPVRSVYVSDGVLQALAVKAEAGRWLGAADQDPNGKRSAVLGYGYWQGRFGGDRSVIGRIIQIDSRPVEVVGVMPRGFKILDVDAALILPYRFDRSQLTISGFGHQGIARLKPGVTIAQANGDLKRMMPVWEKSWPSTALSQYYLKTWRIAPAIRVLKTDVIGNVGDHLWPLMGTVLIVMLIACANVANLLLVRGSARQQELAIRAALGAGWGRLLWERLIESLELGLAGGAIGVGLAYEGLRLLVAWGPATLPRLNEISLDTRALAFSVAISIGSGLLFGLIPALKYRDGIAPGGRRSSANREENRARNVLVIVQVAMSLVLLVSAGLMIRTFANLLRVDAGFTGAEQLQTMRIGIPTVLAPEPDRVVQMQREIVSKLEAIPGVESAGFTVDLPMEGLDTNWDEIFAEGDESGSHERPVRLFKFVSPDLFRTMGTNLIAGRDFTWTDVEGKRDAVMVSENLARELWGSARAAIGKRIHTAPATAWREVIGVVQDVRNNGRDAAAPATVYWPSRVDNMYPRPSQYVARNAAFLIRSGRAGTAALAEEARQAAWSVNADLTIGSVQTMAEVAAKSMARTSFTLAMLTLAGTMALLLGVVGLYGAIAYAVSQRTREMGIRLALGAEPARLRAMFLQQGLTLAAIGVAVGVAGAAMVMRLMTPVLFGVAALDPATYVAAAAVMIVAAALASYVPARRAAAVDPMTALRDE